jgi:hypothetical protein
MSLEMGAILVVSVSFFIVLMANSCLERAKLESEVR